MSATAIPADALSYVCSIVRDRSAIELEASKNYLIEARLAPLAKQHGFSSPAELIQGVRAKRNPDLEQRLIEAMTTNETSFFRDVHPFDALRTAILPAMIARNASQRSLNVWSAACSTGQELYSAGMLLHEYFPEVSSWKLGLFGTDLSTEVLARASTGRFSQLEVNRGLPATLLMKYFRRDGVHWQICPALTSSATFQKLNLIDPWPRLPLFDVVFLRNVLIYFAPEAKRRILQNVCKVMAPEGVLFLGAAETTMGLDLPLDRQQAGNCSYYRVRQSR